MTEGTQKRLRALLKAYEERTPHPKPGVERFRDEEERRRRQCGERLQKVVSPVLRDFASALRDAGHEASIEDVTDSPDEYPSAALTFTPRTSGTPALASTLAFRYDPRRGIAVQRDVKPAASKGKVVTGSLDRVGTMTPESVTREWVETKTLSFVEAVLRLN